MVVFLDLRSTKGGFSHLLQVFSSNMNVFFKFTCPTNYNVLWYLFLGQRTRSERARRFQPWHYMMICSVVHLQGGLPWFAFVWLESICGVSAASKFPRKKVEWCWVLSFHLFNWMISWLTRNPYWLLNWRAKYWHLHLHGNSCIFLFPIFFLYFVFCRENERASTSFSRCTWSHC